ncbi:hypothetical protein MN202_03340 [Rheinheimera muenzenbergensis]|uniref:Uncharacterized protein n=1 Tax=Rheinheimera muenzenbergensis TaxID=1193628 RepID=A0ABU8C370_9GAMM
MKRRLSQFIVRLAVMLSAALLAAASLAASASTSANEPGPVAVIGYYQLTEQNLADMAQRQALIDAVAALEGQLFTERYQLVNALQPLLRPIKRHTDDYLAQLITSSSQPAEANDSDTDNAAQTSTVYTLSSEGLLQWQQRPEIASLPEAELKPLALLQDQIFNSEPLMQVALDNIGFAAVDANTGKPLASAEQSRLRQLVYSNAFKAGHWPEQAPLPLRWQATADCGCAAEIIKQERFTNFSYGFVPYWQTDVSEIAFNTFNRIGLYSFTLGEHNQLQSPPNWRNNRQFNDFINTAQAHNTYLDIVVTAFDHISYQAADLQRLRQQLVAEVTTPMAGFALNNLQPWLSFGLSSRRTLADGITFNLDLTALTAAEQLNFATFLRDLRADLKLPAQAATTDNYFINLKVPARAVLTAALPQLMPSLSETAAAANMADTLYAPEKLAELAPLVNLLLVRFDHSVEAALSQPSGAAHEPYPFRREMKFLKTAIDTMASAEEATMLLEKILPLFEMTQLQQTGQLSEADFSNDLTYANWNFSGAAFWTLPLSQAQYKVVQQAFSVPDNYAYQHALQQLCDQVCPKRWFWRLVLALLLLSVLLLYLLATLFYYPLQRWLEHPALLYGVPLVFAVGLLLILSCDPYWHQFQSLILVAVLAAVVLGFMLYRRRQLKREHYP